MPNRRSSVRGVDIDGRSLELALSFSKQLYVCPNCRKHIEIGEEHVVVRILESGAGSFHQHWHSACVKTVLLRKMREVRHVPARRR